MSDKPGNLFILPPPTPIIDRFLSNRLEACWRRRTDDLYRASDRACDLSTGELGVLVAADLILEAYEEEALLERAASDTTRLDALAAQHLLTEYQAACEERRASVRTVLARACGAENMAYALSTVQALRTLARLPREQ